MTKVLVAGASGKLGAEILLELKKQNIATRALVRNPLSLRSKPDELFIADARNTDQLKGICENVDIVISAMGASLQLGKTKDKATFQAVDYQGNKNILEQALNAGARKFIYVSLAGAANMAGLAYVEAHEAFVSELKKSGINYSIIRPTGFFYLFEEVLKMARRKVVPLFGEGKVKTNPIHEADLAEICVQAINSTETEIKAGGPVVYTRREIAELAAEVLGQTPRFIHVPPQLANLLIAPVKLFDRRMGELLAFGVAVNLINAVAPCLGRQNLADYFATLVKKNRNKI